MSAPVQIEVSKPAVASGRPLSAGDAATVASRSGSTSASTLTPASSPREAGTSDAARPAPFDASQLQAIADGRQRRKSLDRACKFAAFGGWSTAVLAVCGAPFALFSIESAVVAAGLAVVAYHEFKGRRMLGSLDPAAPRLLGFNQVGFVALIVGYCLWKIAGAVWGQPAYAAEIAAEPLLADALAPVGDLVKVVTIAVYAAMIPATIMFQGGMAWYYFSRSTYLKRYVEETPDWVRQLHMQGLG